jgi:replication factor A1
VRNALLRDGDDELRIVLWGENALVPLSPGDTIEVYHATAKAGKYGGIELGVGRGSAFRVPQAKARQVVFSGTIMEGPGGFFIDNGRERYLVDGDFVHGTEVRITGTLTGSRIIPEKIETVELKAEEILAEIRRFRESLPQ